MKKYIFVGMFLALAFANPVHADVATSTTEVYQSSLRQLITLLQQEVAMLVAQLQSISDNQARITNQLITMNTQTNKPAEELTTSSVTPVEILVNNQSSPLHIDFNGNQSEPFAGTVSIKYSDGSIVESNNTTKLTFAYHTSDKTDHGLNVGTFNYRPSGDTDVVTVTYDNLLYEIDFNVTK